MKGIPIRATITVGLNNESNKSICIEAVADIDDSKTFFIVHSFKDVTSNELLPINEITLRYVAETTVPHWIDEKYKLPSVLSQELGRAIEATGIGKEYIALCFLRTSQ